MELMESYISQTQSLQSIYNARNDLSGHARSCKNIHIVCHCKAVRASKAYSHTSEELSHCATLLLDRVIVGNQNETLDSIAVFPDYSCRYL